MIDYVWVCLFWRYRAVCLTGMFRRYVAVCFSEVCFVCFKRNQVPTVWTLLLVESWAKCIGVSYTSLYVHGKPVQFSCKSCTANRIYGESHFRITMALKYSIWWLVIRCCMSPNSSSPPFEFALNAWMQNERCTNRCDVVHWSNSHL